MKYLIILLGVTISVVASAQTAFFTGIGQYKHPSAADKAPKINNQYEHYATIKVQNDFQIFKETMIAQGYNKFLVLLNNSRDDAKENKFCWILISPNGTEIVTTIEEKPFADKKTIQKAFKLFRDEPLKGQKVVVSVSAHAGKVPDNDPKGDDGGFDEVLYAYDALIGVSDENTFLRDDEVGQNLDAIRQKTGDKGLVFCLFDACHSGGLDRSVSITDTTWRTGYAPILNQSPQSESKKGGGWIESNTVNEDKRGTTRGLGMAPLIFFASSKAGVSSPMGVPVANNMYGTLFYSVRVGIERLFDQDVKATNKPSFAQMFKEASNTIAGLKRNNPILKPWSGLDVYKSDETVFRYQTSFIKSFSKSDLKYINQNIVNMLFKSKGDQAFDVEVLLNGRSLLSESPIVNLTHSRAIENQTLSVVNKGAFTYFMMVETVPGNSNLLTVSYPPNTPLPEGNTEKIALQFTGPCTSYSIEAILLDEAIDINKKSGDTISVIDYNNWKEQNKPYIKALLKGQYEIKCPK